MSRTNAQSLLKIRGRIVLIRSTVLHARWHTPNILHNKVSASIIDSRFMPLVIMDNGERLHIYIPPPSLVSFASSDQEFSTWKKRKHYHPIVTKNDPRSPPVQSLNSPYIIYYIYYIFLHQCHPLLPAEINKDYFLRRNPTTENI